MGFLYGFIIYPYIYPIKTSISPIKSRHLPLTDSGAHWGLVPGAVGAAQRAVAGQLWPWGAEPDAATAPAQLRRRVEPGATWLRFEV